MSFTIHDCACVSKSLCPWLCYSCLTCLSIKLLHSQGQEPAQNADHWQQEGLEISHRTTRSLSRQRGVSGIYCSVSRCPPRWRSHYSVPGTASLIWATWSIYMFMWVSQNINQQMVSCLLRSYPIIWMRMRKCSQWSILKKNYISYHKSWPLKPMNFLI